MQLIATQISKILNSKGDSYIANMNRCILRTFLCRVIYAQNTLTSYPNRVNSTSNLAIIIY